MMRRSPINRASSRRVLALLVIAVALALSPGPASAGTWTVKNCHRGGTVAQQSGTGWFGRFAGYVHGDNAGCPEPGLTLGVDTRSIPGMGMWWHYDAQDSGRIGPSVLRVRLHGGDTAHGVVYGVTGCPVCEIDVCGGCDFSATFGERTPADDEQADQVVTVDLDPRRSVWLVAACTTTGCHSDRDLELSDIELVWNDDTPPVIDVQTPAHPGALDGTGTTWLRPGEEDLKVTVTDANGDTYHAGAGVAAATGTIDQSHTPFWESTDLGCALGDEEDDSWPAKCSAAVGYSQSVDLGGLADGPHTMTFTARDGVGNVAEPRTEEFQIDGTPPPALTGLTVTADDPIAPSGWTTAEAVVLSWDAPVADSGSPIDEIHYRLESSAGVPVAGTDGVAGPNEQVTVHLPVEGQYRIAAWAQDAAGNRGEKQYRVIGDDTDAPLPPRLAGHRWLATRDLLTGVTQTWPAPPDLLKLESGVCGYAVDVSRLRDGDPGRVISLSAPATAWPIPGPLADGRHYVHVRAISCAGRASDPAVAALDVDTVAPTTRLAGVPTSDWSQAPYAVELSGEDAGSGVERVRWSIDGGAARDEAAPAIVDATEGSHVLRYSTVDVAGNESAPTEQPLRVDATPPAVALGPRDRSHPAQVRATAVDALSGIDRAWIEIRSRSSSGAGWQRISPVATPTSGAAQVELIGVLPDDTAPAGTYDVRAVASDRAGNATDTSRHSLLSEGGATLTLPVRAPTAVQVAIGRVVPTCTTRRGESCKANAPCPSACKRGTRVDATAAGTKRVLRFEEQAAVVGSLVGPDTRALGNTRVELTITSAAGPIDHATVVTDRLGRFTLPLPLGPSRSITARYHGSDLLAPSSASAWLTVKSGVSLRLSHTKLHGGSTIVFSGTVRGGPGVNVADKVVQVQYARGNTWAMTTAGGRTDARGRFRIPWTTDPVKGPVRLTFRAFVARDGGWPFEDGGSAKRHLTIVP